MNARDRIQAVQAMFDKVDVRLKKTRAKLREKPKSEKRKKKYNQAWEAYVYYRNMLSACRDHVVYEDAINRLGNTLFAEVSNINAMIAKAVKDGEYVKYRGFFKNLRANLLEFTSSLAEDYKELTK